MLRLVRFIGGGLVLAACLLWAQAAEAAVYTSPEGIRFRSESPAWDSQDKLRQLYEELKNNVHGEELKLLAEVTVVDGYPRGKGTAGEYRLQTTVDFRGRYKMLQGRIELYGGREHTTVESFAKTLAHEYGHHVTHYVSIRQDGFPLTDPLRWRQSSYAKIRGLAGDPRVNQSSEHRWQLAEIAAEDYVQLFGSPNAKKPHLFPSRFEQLQAGKEPGTLQWDASMFNVVPQENLELPLATKVPGLYEWFARHLGVRSAPVFPDEPELTIKEVIKMGREGYQLRFSWSGGRNDPATLYTLVAYGDGEVLPEPVVTRTGRESLEARYGTYMVRTRSAILTYKDPKATGRRHFRVYAQNAAGFVASSAILTVDMNKPDQVTVTTFTVLQTQPAETQNIKQNLEMNDGLAYESNIPAAVGWLLDWVKALLEVILRIVEHISKLLS